MTTNVLKLIPEMSLMLSDLRKDMLEEFGAYNVTAITVERFRHADGRARFVIEMDGYAHARNNSSEGSCD